MKKIIPIIIFISACFSLLTSAQINLSNTGNECEYPCVAFMNGEVIVVWGEKEAGIFNLFYRIYKDNTWSSKRRIYKTGLHSEFPQIAADSATNTIHMVWMEGTSRGNREIMYSYYKNGIWSSYSKAYASSMNSCWPKIRIKADSTLNIVWTHEISPYNNLAYVIQHTWKSAFWHKTGMDVSRTHSTISIHPDLDIYGNSAYAVWMDGHEGSWSLLFSHNSGSSWSSPRVVSDNKGGWWPSIAADSKGNIIVFYATLFASPYYTEYKDGTWSKPAPVPGSANYSRDFNSITCDSGDNFHLAWRQMDKQRHHNVVYTARTNEGKWAAPVTVSESITAVSPVIRHDGNDKVHIVWHDSGINHGDVFYTAVETSTVITKNPVASFTADPETGIPPLAVKFDASSSEDADGEITSYQWNFRDGTTASGKIVSHTFKNRGEYNVKLIVTDDDGLTGEIEKFIYVSDPPKACFSASPGAGVAPASIQFTSLSSDPDGKITAVKWDFGDSKTSSVTAPVHVFEEPGEYNVKLEVQDNYGIKDDVIKTIRIYSVHAPSSVKYEYRSQRSMLLKEDIMILTWSQNPQNSNRNIVKYKIYRRYKGNNNEFQYVDEVDNSKKEWLKRKVDPSEVNKFEYTVSAVDNLGRESIIGPFPETVITPFNRDKRKNRYLINRKISKL